jgi:hypothetical protein
MPLHGEDGSLGSGSETASIIPSSAHASTGNLGARRSIARACAGLVMKSARPTSDSSNPPGRHFTLCARGTSHRAMHLSDIDDPCIQVSDVLLGAAFPPMLR